MQRREIRASYDRESIVVYQAFPDDIADAALREGRFVEPFSLRRMTWIKPSFLWLMARSSWGRARGQERILAVHLGRESFESVLSLGVLTAYEPRVHGDYASWERAFAAAEVHIQWDPERTLRGAKLEIGSLQVGIGRGCVGRYVDEWVAGISEITPKVRKMRALLDAGRAEAASELLPAERVLPIDEILMRRLGM